MRKPSKRLKPDAGLGSPQHCQSENVGIDAPAQKRAYQHKLSKEARSRIAREAARKRIPSEPHPDNLKLVGPRPDHFEGFASVQEWLGAKGREIRARQLQSACSFVAWCAWDAFADEVERRLEDYARHPDRPVSTNAVDLLRRALGLIRSDLPKTRPF